MTVIPILLYHSVCDDPPGWIAKLAVSRRTFAEHVDVIAASGRTPMTVSDLGIALRKRVSLPDRPILITFDDGFADFADAAQILAKHHIPSTLYVTTGALAGRGPRPGNLALPPAAMLDWSQLAELKTLDVELGGHTHTHRQLDTLRADDVAEDILRSKAMLEDALGHEVPSFAYPYGFHCDETVQVVRNSGHTSACAVMNALSSDADDVFALARLTIQATTSRAEIAAWLDGRGARVAPYRERLRTKGFRAFRRTRHHFSARVIAKP